MDYSGQRFEHYQLITKLGQGGMATVYKAYDTRLERDVAIKVVRKESIPPEQLERILKRFEREAKALARFIHPNIVPVHDYGEYQGAPFLVMAYLPGGTLKERIGQPVPAQEALGYVIPIASALSYAHQRGVIHRDVKPGNILTTEDGALMLSDFGIAQILEEATTQLTATGMGVGTPEYMAPEQWQGKATAASDQYALGVVLFELLTGRKPFSAETPLAVALKVMSEPLPRPRDLAPEIPEELEKVLYKALARDPQDRFENMEKFQKAIQAIISDNALKQSEVILDKSPQPVQNNYPDASPIIEGMTFDEIDSTPIENQDSPPKTDGAPEGKGHPKTRQVNHPKQGKRIVIPIISISGFLVILAICLAVYFMPASWWCNLTGNSLEGCEISNNNQNINVSDIPIPTPESFPEINARDGAEMVYVPAGEFLMGSEDANADSDEEPEHTVYLDDYWIYKYEVTNEQYAEFLNEMGNQTEGGVTWLDAGDEDANIHRSGGEWVVDSGYEDHPVVEVTWYGGQAYCEWAGGRLPTEAEWEKAARGTEGQTYPWGEESPTCSLAQFWGCPGETVPVGSFPGGASPYGALDMAGNVLEWVADWYDEDYYQHSPLQNPTGPASGTYRVIRGGSWNYRGLDLRASIRYRNIPDNSYNYFGFRCLSSP